MSLVKKRSMIHGIGIFTDSPIPTIEDYYCIPMDRLLSTPAPRCARIDIGRYVDDPHVLNWVNHSCDPNSRISGSSLRSLREIMAGEEITVDYSVTEIDGMIVKCNCGSNKCKGYFKKEV